MQYCTGATRLASPILSNIYLDRLDQFVEQQLLPAYNHGRRRRPNPAYQTVEYQIQRARRHGDRQALPALRQQRRRLPSQDPNDPGYRRLRYCRYADDWLLGFAGPRHEAEQIKSKIQAFLREELRLELSESKTLITHATSQAARFLGYEIKAQHADTKITRGRRAVNGAIGLFVPKDVIRQRCALYLREGNPAQRGALLHDDDFTTVAKYQAEYRGLVSTTCSPKTCSAWASSSGSWRPHCSRPWPASTAPRSPRWLESTRRRSRHPTDPATASRLSSSVRREERHWSPGSAASRSGDTARLSYPTAHRSWPAPDATS